jgi:hypothetical protein
MHPTPTSSFSTSKPLELCNEGYFNMRSLLLKKGTGRSLSTTTTVEADVDDTIGSSRRDGGRNRAPTRNRKDNRGAFSVTSARSFVPTMSLDDIDEWVSRLEAHCSSNKELGQATALPGDPGISWNAGAVLDVARSAMKWSRRHPERAAELCERLLIACLTENRRQWEQRQQQQQDQSDDFPSGMHIRARHPPVADLYNLVLISWGNTRSEAGAVRAQQIFDLLQKSYDAFRGSTTTPTAVVNVDNAADRSFPPPPSPRPDRRAYKSIIRAWSISAAASGPTRAHQLLKEMEAKSGVSDLLLRNDRRHHRRGSAVSPPKANPIPPLSQREGVEPREEKDTYRSSPSTSLSSRTRSLPPPDRAIYNTVLSAYAKSPVLYHPIALQKMTAIVARMDRLYEMTGDEEYRLDSYSYQALLLAYSRYVRTTTPPLDQAILGKIQDVLARMNSSTSASSTEGIAKGVSGKQPNHSHEQFSEETKDVVSRPWAVGVLVEALVKTGDPRDVELATEYLRVLSGRAEPGPEMLGFSSSPSPGPSRRSLFTHNSSVTNLGIDYPTQESLWKVIQALERIELNEGSSTASAEDGIKASGQEKIDEMIRIAIEAPFDRVFFVNQAAEFWCQTGWSYAPDLIEKLMERSWDKNHGTYAHLTPTGETFAIAMRAWLRCTQRVESPHRCELLLQQMLNLYEESGDRYIRPRDEHLRFVMMCWLNRCHDGRRYHGMAGYLYPAEHIEAHLRWLVSSEPTSQSSSSVDVSSDWVKNVTGHFSMAIRAWAKQVVVDGDDEPDAVERAIQLRDQLKQTLGHLPAYPCNWCLDIFSQPQPSVAKRKKAFDAAIETFRLGKRNPRSFVLIIQVLKSQIEVLDEKHLEIIEELFHECCSCGMLTQHLIWHVVDVLNPQSLQKLFGISYQYASALVQMRENELDQSRMQWTGIPPSALMVRNLPQGWSCNAESGCRVARLSS